MSTTATTQKKRPASAMSEDSECKKIKLVHLNKSLAWVNYVLRDANYNGWKEFNMNSASVKDKSDHHVFTNGMPMNLRYAMELSKHYWSPREEKGERKDLWDEFNTTYTTNN